MTDLLKQARITDEMIEDMRARMHIPLRPRIVWNSSSCYDSVNHFCQGIGDDNPIFVNREYGKTAALGVNLAPPSFLYSICMSVVQMGFPGIHGFHSGTDWRWFRPILQGEELKVLIWLDSIEERPSRMGGRSIVLYFSNVFSNGNDDVVAYARGRTVRMERGAARERKTLTVEPHNWDPEAIANIESAYASEKARGAEPRYWEDVEVGDAIAPIVKGPLCMSDMISFYAGAMVAPTPAHRLAYKDYVRHPLWYFRNKENGGLEPIIRVHENIEAARNAGVPAPYDVGVQRHAWLIHAITDWMGDDAFLDTNSVQFRAFNYYGDLQRFTGAVTRKFVENGDHKVELEVRGTNQNGVVTIPGNAVVVLPTRGGVAPVKRFNEVRIKLADHLASLGASELLRAQPGRA
ncbi:MAG TPA: MaoC family dehydratase N-terminal domain-containing protein [Rhizomicrobium sp.]|nr:MaoC family dehydratase N-terminal domain-containing protein [Rhizomicrobium sp.]